MLQDILSNHSRDSDCQHAWAQVHYFLAANFRKPRNTQLSVVVAAAANHTAPGEQDTRVDVSHGDGRGTGSCWAVGVEWERESGEVRIGGQCL